MRPGPPSGKTRTTESDGFAVQSRCLSHRLSHRRIERMKPKNWPPLHMGFLEILYTWDVAENGEFHPMASNLRAMASNL